MSIDDEIKERIGSGDLLQFIAELPFREETGSQRKLWISRSIAAHVYGTNGKCFNSVEESRWRNIRVELAEFVSGSVVVLPRHRIKNPPKKPQSHMAQLRPPKLEVWETRHCVPSPGIRLLGRFVRQNEFVALTWRERPYLGDLGSAEWEEAINECRSEWQRLFSSPPLTKGAYPDDYITNWYLV